MDYAALLYKCGLVPIAQAAAANSALLSKPEVTSSPGASSVNGTTTKYDSSFRFLDLPKDIRLMVYEFLPIRTIHHKMLDTESERRSADYISRLTLVIKSLEGVAILRTCRLINAEATAVLQPALKFIREDPMRIITNDLFSKARSLNDIFRQLMTKEGYKLCQTLDSPSLRNPAIQNFLHVTRAKGGLPQIHIALDVQGDFDVQNRVQDHLFGITYMLFDGRYNNQVLCIVHQRWMRVFPNKRLKERAYGDVIHGVPDSSIPECKWVVHHKPDIDLVEWGRVWAEGVEYFNL